VADETPNLTLVQISDLHIGELDPATGNAQISSLVRKIMANSSWFDGVLGHHSRGLEHLAKFWRTLKAQEPHVRLIVSGDVTSCGGLTEFKNASEFVSAKLAMPVGALGLDFPRWRKAAIPGNHDHWPGSATIFGNPLLAVKSTFLSGYPFIETIPRGTDAPLRIVCINTDSDVSSHGYHRFFAIGDFQSQLVAASRLLAKEREPGIGVLLMHHSWHKRGLLGISRASRAALAQFLEQENIRVVLTGHVHTPLVQSFDIPLPGNTRYRVHECRCGTTTQMDKMAYDATSLFGNFPMRPKWPANTLLVHRISAGMTGLPVWRVETYVRTRQGFRQLGNASKFTL
jgi:calcineurin-like phosphoesterase family protein